MFELLLPEDRRSAVLQISVLIQGCYFIARRAVTLLLVFSYRRYEGDEETTALPGSRITPAGSSGRDAGRGEKS